MDLPNIPWPFLTVEKLNEKIDYCKTNQQLIIEPRSSLHALFCYGACLACILLIFRLCMADSGA